MTDQSVKTSPTRSFRVTLTVTLEDLPDSERDERAEQSDCIVEDLPTLADMTAADLRDAVDAAIHTGSDEMWSGSECYVRVCSTEIELPAEISDGK